MRRAAADEVDPCARLGSGRTGQGDVDALDRPGRHQLGAQLALLGVVDRRVDGVDGVQRPLEPAAGVEQDLVELVRIGVGKPLADVRRQGVAPRVGELDDPGHDLGVVEDPTDHAASVTKRPGLICTPSVVLMMSSRPWASSNTTTSWSGRIAPPPPTSRP